MVAEEVRSASVFVSFSNFENQPCSILEALCCGVPVISTNVGGISEIIDSENGILIEPRNESQLLKALEDIIDQYHKFDREKISDDAKKKFSFDTVGRQLYSLYLSD